MTCPYLQEALMLFCRAYPVRKMVPLEKVGATSACTEGDFHDCPLFKEAAARARGLCPLRISQQQAETPEKGKGVGK